MGSGINEVREGQYTSGLNKLLQAKKYIPNKAELWNALGMAYFAKKDFVKSEESFKHAMALKPEDNSARSNLGAIYLEQGKLGPAQRELEAVLKDLAFTEQDKTLFNLGLLHDKLGNRLKAADYYARAIKENPNFCQAWMRLSDTQIATGKREDAIQSLRSASNGLCYGNMEAHYQLGVVLAQDRDLDLAKNKFEEILRRFPKSPWAKLSEEKLRTMARK